MYYRHYYVNSDKPINWNSEDLKILIDSDNQKYEIKDTGNLEGTNYQFNNQDEILKEYSALMERYEIFFGNPEDHGELISVSWCLYCGLRFSVDDKTFFSITDFIAYIKQRLNIGE